MASSKPPPKEATVCVRVPSREGKERIWQAIELWRRTPPSPKPLPQPPAQPHLRAQRQAKRRAPASGIGNFSFHSAPTVMTVMLHARPP